MHAKFGSVPKAVSKTLSFKFIIGCYAACSMNVFYIDYSSIRLMFLYSNNVVTSTISKPSDLIWSGVVWSGLVWPGLAWSGLVWPFDIGFMMKILYIIIAYTNYTHMRIRAF